MLVFEQYLTPHANSIPTPSMPQPPVFEMPQLAGDPAEYDLDRTDVETDITLPAGRDGNDRPLPPVLTVRVVTHPLTLGLVIHSLADGLALGASASGEHNSNTSLSLVVFIALIIHKCLHLWRSVGITAIKSYVL